MSLARMVYYSSIVCGWMAFLGWLGCETFLFGGQGPSGSRLEVLLVGAVIGAMIGAGFNLVSGWTNPMPTHLAKVAGIGFLAGSIGGGLGGFLGDLLYTMSLPRALGFLILGVGVGVTEGVYEKSLKKIRNGAIGGAVGGIIGGALFDPLASIFTSTSGMSSRATAFVVLGLCVGGAIGAANVILREAWLTVLDGYRPGRQLILGDTSTVLGRADHLRLPFLGPASKNLNPEHARITRLANGRYEIVDNDSAIGTFVNHQRTTQHLLSDGDIIKLGANLVRFSERVGERAGEGPASKSDAPGAPSKPLPKPPTPPPRKKVEGLAHPAESETSTPIDKPKPTSSSPQGLLPPPPPPPARKK